MNEAVTPGIASLLGALFAHMAFDVLPLIPLGGLLALAMIERGSGKRPGRGTVVGIAMAGLALGTPAIAHIRVLASLVRLPEWDWVHHVALAMIYGAIALPVAFAVGRWRRIAVWLLVAGAIAWLPFAAQAILIAANGPATVERVELMRSAAEINSAATHLDPGALARAIDRLKSPADPREFDQLIYPALLAALKSQQPEVARAAARKIEARGNAESLFALLEARPEAPPIARDAIEVAANTLAGRQDATDVLYRMVMQSGERGRGEALGLLYKYHPDFLQQNLNVILRAGDDEIRAMVTKMMRGGTSGAGADLVGPLLKALSSPDNAERGKALDSLLTLLSTPGVKDKIDPKPIIKILETGSVEQQRTAARLLKELSPQEAIPALTGGAGADDNQLARLCLETLIKMGAAKDSALFSRHLENPEAAMRALAYRGLRETLDRNLKLDDPLVRRIETAARKEKDAEPRRYAAILLAWLDLKSAYSYAESLLAGGKAGTEDKLAAIAAFELLGEGRAIPKLTDLARDGSPKVRKAAITALGHIGDQSTAEVLKRFLDDPDSSVREAAQSAITDLTARPSEPAAPERPLPQTTSERPAPGRPSPGPPPGPPPEQPPW